MSNNTRSLLMDSLNLPRFNTIDEFAKLTGLSKRLLYCLSMETNRYYKYTTIPKKNGDARQISKPSYTLHILQRWILVNILEKISPSNRAMAFRRGLRFGSKQNALYHSHTLYGLSVDLKDFFPSISSNQVYTIFSNIGYGDFAATILTHVCTLEGILPQGSACSPIISNIVCITLDKRLIGLCEKRGIRFTRYADDMYFSCDDKTLLLKNYPVIKKIIEDEQFTLNERKIHFHTPSNKKRITGVTVATTSKEDFFELKASKFLKKKIRAEIYKCIMSGDYMIKNHILGEISYVNFIEKENAITYISRIKKYILAVFKKIDYLPELVEAYNTNLFFKDMNTQNVNNFEFNYDEDGMFFVHEREERQKFLKKHKIADICNYSGWPELQIQNSQFSDTEDLPF